MESTGLSWGNSNYGSVVDIWAPTCIRTTVTRDSAARDSNNTGIDELLNACGTSTSAPYLTGIVSLMKMLDGSLRQSQVESILKSTANTSTDSKVTTGYVDALRAVMAADPNDVPTVDITIPATLPYLDAFLKASVTDPEAPTVFWGPADFSSKIVFSSNIDGTLCTDSDDATGSGTAMSCTASVLSVGAHTITATVTDPFGAKGTDTAMVTVVNVLPTATITHPADGASFFTSQLVNLRGFGFDSDEVIPSADLSWKSSIGGALGTGTSIWVSLAAGAHTITLTVEDSLGAKGTDTITVNMVAGAGHPTAQILKPKDNQVLSPGTLITFEGKGTDPEDGTLTGAALTWKSDVDGALGTGTTFLKKLSSSTCGTVLHNITLTATDSNGNTSSHTIRVSVADIC